MLIPTDLTPQKSGSGEKNPKDEAEFEKLRADLEVYAANRQQHDEFYENLLVYVSTVDEKFITNSVHIYLGKK